MRSTFNILFYINRNKQKKDGKCPIMGRITVDGKSTQFSIQEAIEPNLWSVEKSCSVGKDKEAKMINQKLEQYQAALKQHYNRLVEEDAYVTVESLKNALLGIGVYETMLLKEFQAHNDEYAKSVGVTKSKSSYLGYVHAYKSLEKFLLQKCEVEDIAFKQLQYSFIEDFEFFLSVHLNFAPNTVMNVILKLKRIVHRAINKEIIRKNPFADYRCKQGESNRKWLSKTELDILMQTPMKKGKPELVRVLFLFSCFCGLSFADLYHLKWENISTDKHGTKWIRIKRAKTGTESIVPILAIPERIIEQYSNPKGEEKVFDVPSYALTRYYLKEIETKTQLKPLSFHQSRHTWATTVCLSNGVPIETLSRTMGHKKNSATQIYAKITGQKINEDMQALEQRLGNKYELPKIK